jgi:hypothetical protein
MSRIKNFNEFEKIYENDQRMCVLYESNTEEEHLDEGLGDWFMNNVWSPIKGGAVKAWNWVTGNSSKNEKSPGTRAQSKPPASTGTGTTKTPTPTSGTPGSNDYSTQDAAEEGSQRTAGVGDIILDKLHKSLRGGDATGMIVGGKLAFDFFSVDKKSYQKLGSSMPAPSPSTINKAISTTKGLDIKEDPFAMTKAAMEKEGKKVEAPDYKKLTGSEYYLSNWDDLLDLSWEGIYKSLKKRGQDIDTKKYNLVAFRNKKDVKFSSSNRFVDLFVILSPKDDKTVEKYLGTTTPAPVYLYEPYRNYLIAVGVKWLGNSKGSTILNPGKYTFIPGRFEEMSKDCLTQESSVSISERMPSKNLSDAKEFKSYDPGSPKSGDFKMRIYSTASSSQSTIDNISNGSMVMVGPGSIEKIKNACLDKNNEGKINFILVEL